MIAEEFDRAQLSLRQNAGAISQIPCALVCLRALPAFATPIRLSDRVFWRKSVEPFFANLTRRLLCAKAGREHASPHVFLKRHGFQVVGVDARGIPAQVVDDKTIGNGPIGVLVKRSMGIAAIPTTKHEAVASAVATTLPNPTTGHRVHDVIDRMAGAPLMPANKTTPRLRAPNVGQRLAAAARANRRFGDRIRLHCSDLLDRSGDAVPGGVLSARPAFRIVAKTA